MITDSLLQSCTHELTICQHLYTKLDPALQDWRPRENMRSTLELLQYLTHIGGTMTQHFVDPLVDHDQARERYIASANRSKTVTFAEFPEVMEREKAAIRSAFETINDSDLTKPTYHPFNPQEITLFEGLMTVQRYLTAYRHQLFLYAKMCGAEINTRNNWAGVDPVKAATA